MRKRFTIVFILLNMIVNFFVFSSSNIHALEGFNEGDPCGTDGWVIVNGSCTYVGGSPDDTDAGSEGPSDSGQESSNYYSSDGKIRCTMRLYTDGTLKPQYCWEVGPNGERGDQVPIDDIDPQNFQIVNKEKYTAKDGTYFQPLSIGTDELFDFSLKDDLLKPIEWLYDRKTYVVIKEVEGEKAVYWNVPNVQQQLINTVINKISANSGYTDNTYTPESRMVPVGHDDSYMTKYGFEIPSYKYNGEVSIVLMSLNRILPTNWWSAAWRTLKVTFGGSSFLNAPDVDNYASMQYIGNDYGENQENLINFIADNWDEYFVKAIYRAGEKKNGDYKCNGKETTFCDFTLGTIYHNSFDEPGVKKKGSKNYYYNGTITQMYISPQAVETSIQWIQNFFFRLQDVDGNYIFTTSDVNSSTNFYGKTADTEHYYDAEGMSVTKHEIAVEDIKTFDEQTQKIIEYDKSQAMIIADNRCRLLQSGSKDVTEKRDGLEDWNPENYKDDYYYDKTIEEETYYPADYDYTTGGFTACNAGDHAYSGTCVHKTTTTVRELDEEAFEHDKQYWEDGKGSPATTKANKTPYKGKDQEINNIDACVEQYDKLYDKCVKYSNSTFADEEMSETLSLNDNQKICALSREKSYRVPTYTYSASSSSQQMYGTGKTDYNYAANDRENWFFKIHYTYKFERPLNYKTTYPSATSTEFNKGYDTMRLFGSRKMLNSNDQDNNVFPSPKIIKDVVGIDTAHGSSVDGAYALNVENISKYRLYNLHWNASFKAAKTETGYLFYNQCLIDSFTENQCLTEDGNQLYLKNIFADNGVWDIEMDPTSNKWIYEKEEMIKEKSEGSTEPFMIDDDELKRQKAELIISKIQAASAQYYDTVMNNIIQLMIRESGGDIDFEDNLPQRVMPYNIDSMIAADAAKVGVVDPRYEGTVLEKIVNGDFSSVFTIDFTGAVATKLLSFIGTVSEISVMLTQFMTFSYLDQIGLNPTTMWTTFFINVAIGALVLWFIFRLVGLGYKFVKGNAGLKEVIVRFVLFLIMLGFLVITSVNPQRVWAIIEKGTTSIFMAGEKVGLSTNQQLNSLVKSKSNDPSVALWVPYFDAWSLYNTGYSVTENAQAINTSQDVPEVKGSHWRNGAELWSVVLADSFLYDEHRGNLNVDKKAYRVVDHFMAPRVTILSAGGGNTIDVKQNENYNGMFQRNVLGLIPKAMGVVLVMLLTVIKFLTFLYLWYMLYMFMINILLAMNTQKDLIELFKKTFIPAFQLFIIGLWTSLVIYITSRINSLAGIVIIIGLYYISWRLFVAWKERLGYFPTTLNPLYALPKAITKTINVVKGVFA